MDKKLFSSDEIPLLEFDPDKTALIEPQVQVNYVLKRKNYTFPEYCMMPIYSAVFDHLIANSEIYPIIEFPTSYEKIKLYELNFQGKTFVVVNPGIGAPLASKILEVMIGLGCRKFVACGSGGVLKTELKRGTVIIPSSAVRDEGTSYHYIAPARTIEMDPLVVSKLEAVLKKHHINYETGKTWTTDAFYRETKKKIEKRKVEGCLIVEMECSALLAVARFRNVSFGQYLGAGDDVSGDGWDPRFVNDKMPFTEKLFWLSAEACLSL
jgi:uridine phosphorylase